MKTQKKVSVTSQWLYSSVGITILTDIMAGHTGTDTFFTPTVFRLVDSAKASFVLEHQADFFLTVDNFQFIYSGLNFFEAAISSSLAFLGCLLRGMTLRQL